MYFPLLRSKQYELLALRGMCELGDCKDKISPIIEPVKISPSFYKTIGIMIEHNVNFTIIINPNVGILSKNSSDGETEFERLEDLITETLIDYDNFQLGVYISQSSDFDYIERAHGFGCKSNQITLIYLNEVPERLINNESYVKYNVIDYNNTGRRFYRNFNKDTRVTISDFFTTVKRNADYVDNVDELFSDEYKYYKEDGYIGFSDYVTVGKDFSDGGFRPYAVVIHITYLDDDAKIRIHHFVSDSNDDPEDVAGKFAEALEKLNTWSDAYKGHKTRALYEFDSLSVSGHYPGLGTLKKLSILNHLELVSTL